MKQYGIGICRPIQCHYYQWFCSALKVQKSGHYDFQKYSIYNIWEANFYMFAQLLKRLGITEHLFDIVTETQLMQAHKWEHQYKSRAKDHQYPLGLIHTHTRTLK